MAHSPSLIHLFQRSRYSGEANRESEFGRIRSEEFAVAALGFVLQHDREFKQRFIKFACNLEVSEQDLFHYEVTCQDGHCADLSIVRKDQQAIIVEAKIGSNPQEHQQPWNEKAFWNGGGDGKSGYGFQIYEHQRFQTCPGKYYVLLQNQVEPNMPPSSEDPENVSRKIHCFSRKWGDLPDNDAPDSLVKDLLDSLAELNIPELKLRKYRDMNLTNLDTESAASMFKLLETVAKDLKIFGTAGRINWGVGDERDDAYFGIWVPRLAYEHCAWANFFPDKNAIIGWFGYEGKRNGRVEALTVSFPFGGDGDSAKLKEFLEGKLQLTVESKSDYFFVQKPPNEKESDADWLVSVLKSLRDATKPKGRPT